VFRGLGITLCTWATSNDDSDARDPGAERLPEARRPYFEGAAKLSDKNFLVMPEEEANAFNRRLRTI